MKVIGLVGTFAAGASTAGSIIVKLTGARSSSLSDKIRKDMRRRGIEIVRSNLQKVGNEIRAKDPRYWAKEVIEDAEKAEKQGSKFFVAESIRSLAELEAFRERYRENFMLLAVDAPITIRYERTVRRAREQEEKLTFEQFKASEEREKKVDAAPHEQNLTLVMSKADYSIMNEGSLKELEEKIKDFLRNIMHSAQRKIVLLGPQGSGKGTQAALISKQCRIPHISTGDILRKIASEKSRRGKEFKEIIEKGELVPDKFISELVKERLAKPDCKNGWVLDGYPRNLEQAMFLERFAAPDYAFYFDISDSAAISRLSSRLQCRKCKAIYGKANPPRKKGICDACGGELYLREDDRPEATKKRLKIFHKDTKPLLDFYGEKGVLRKVNGERRPEDIFKDMKNILDEMK